MATPDPELVLADDYAEDDPKLSPLGVINFVLRHRRLLAVTVAVGLIYGVVEALAMPPWYEASVSFVTTKGSARTPVGTVVAGPIDQGDPFDYYSRILSSTAVLDAVLDKTITGGITVRARLGAVEGPVAQRAQLERELLAKSGARLDTTNRFRRDVMSVVTARAGWTDPQTAADLTNAFVEVLADFDREIRSTAARERRVFIENQVGDTLKALTNAEDELRLFRERNRLLAPVVTDTVTGRVAPIPPQLELRRDQLQREVTVQTEVYLSYKKSFEQARIAELDDASAFVVIEPAVPPRSRSGRSRRGLVMFMGLLGVAVGLAMAAVLELRNRVDLNSPEAVELAGHLSAMRHGVSRVGTRTAQALSAPGRTADPQESKTDV